MKKFKKSAPPTNLLTMKTYLRNGIKMNIKTVDKSEEHK